MKKKNSTNVLYIQKNKIYTKYHTLKENTNCGGTLQKAIFATLLLI